MIKAILVKLRIINWCFIFHNAVNKRLDNKSISIETCNTLYKKVDNRIILNFLKIIMKEYINHSGGCPGADMTWENIGNEYGFKTIA
jgi:hypothetical protein